MKILDGVQGSMRTNRRPGARCTVKLGATECAMDALANALEVDPVDLRLMNLVSRGEPVRPELRPMDADLGDDLTQLVKATAVARATGMRIRDLPLTPERVWAALRAAQPPSPPSR